jgi:type IV fimbrial biogenesis protein FimT
MRQPAGFSLIELMIAIVIMGILMTLGIPAFTTYINNAKLRATSQSFHSLVQTARTEAVRRNANVDFLLTNNDFSIVAATALTPSSTGENWVIRTNSPQTLIEGKYGAEGSGRAIGEAPPVQVSCTSGGAAASLITFTGLGRTNNLNIEVICQFTNPSGGTCAAAGGAMRCLNVVVSIGGQARLCDPAATAAGDTRAC